MVRTQIQLTEKQVNSLKRVAAKRGLSMAELIRQGVEVLLRSVANVTLEEKRRRAIAAAGRFHSGQKDLSAKHDEHLAEVFRE